MTKKKKTFVKQLFFKRLSIREPRTQSLREKKQNSVCMLWWRKREYTSNLTDPLHWGDEAENVMKSRWLEFTGKNSREFDTGKKNAPKSWRSLVRILLAQIHFWVWVNYPRQKEPPYRIRKNSVQHIPSQEECMFPPDIVEISTFM